MFCMTLGAAGAGGRVLLVLLVAHRSGLVGHGCEWSNAGDELLTLLCVGSMFVQVTAARQLPATRQAQAHVNGGYLGIITAFMVYAGFATVFGVFAASPQDKLHHFKGGLAADLLEYIISSLEKCQLRCATAAKALELWTARLQV